MNKLPYELIVIIFDNIEKITDKRQYLKTCKLYNHITKKAILSAEDHNAISYFNKFNYYIDYHGKMDYKNELLQFVWQYIYTYCVEKFTLELCYDNYFELIPQSYYSNNAMIVKALCAYNQFELLRHDKNICTHNICKYGAYHGFMDVIQYGIDHGLKIDWEVCENAAYNGHIDIIEWIDIDKNYKKLGYAVFDNNVAEYAALNGHLNIVILAKKLELNVNANALAAAASGGHIDVVRWLLKNGCDRHPNVIARTAMCGQLKMLKSLKKICPWHPDTAYYAKSCGEMKVYNWVIKNL